MGNAAPPSGPDLHVGVSLRELPEGKPFLGRVGEDGVVLVRHGRRVDAISARCTHYTGPLADGEVVGDTIRCPWHHACFSLRTGVAVGPPALAAIACWDVALEGDRLRVLGKRAAHTGPAGNAALGGVADRSVRRIVIVGGGAAGAAAAEMLRREGYDGDVTLVAEEASPPVDRPNLSKDYLAGNAPEEWMPLRDEPTWKAEGVTLKLSTRADRIDLDDRKLLLRGGEAVAWDRLLLATGCSPIRLPIPGADASHVHVLRTLADSRAIISRAATAKRVVVVGASFIGLEVAASLVARGLEVHVVAPDRLPLERVVGPEIGERVRALHEEKGVRFHLEDKPTEIASNAVTLARGGGLPADFVVLGVGVRPELALAEAAGLTIDRGVVVDEQLESSVAGVFVAGDVARYPDARFGGRIRVEHWCAAQAQGQTAARNLLGQRVPFRAVPFFWSQHYDLQINYVGHAEAWDRVDVAGSLADRDAAVALRKAGRTLAIITLGRDRDSLRAEAAFERADEQALMAIVPQK
jgi:NADPH-dependent 2,4-dienoyl-CoA reductase/sulfur reductase-like enzyme/nitrite reductase/ring-hydroxylating ferredoxin subunit